MNKHVHIPVLENQVINYLNPQSDNCIVDCTLGLGGHAKAILKIIGNNGRLFAFEQDERNLLTAQENLKDFKNVTYIHENFENVEEALKKEAQNRGQPLVIHGFLFDLGLSSPHIDDPERGFSFQKDGPLDMRFDTRQKITAASIINTWRREDLITLFRTYGEENNASRIVAEICRHRQESPITRTRQLAEIIERCSFKHFHKVHPATRVFQALRIEVNREVETLQKALLQAVSLLAPGGRVVVISYHSLEDRIVKKFFREQNTDCVCDKKLYPVCICKKIPTLKILTKKPVIPTREEIDLNPRCRSAKLRAAEKII